MTQSSLKSIKNMKAVIACLTTLLITQDISANQDVSMEDNSRGSISTQTNKDETRSPLTSYMATKAKTKKAASVARGGTTSPASRTLEVFQLPGLSQNPTPIKGLQQPQTIYPADPIN